MNKNNFETVTILLAYGFVLAFIKIIYTFFPYQNILDLVVFFIAGYIFRGKVAPHNLAYGLLLILPACALCVFFMVRLGFISLLDGVGTAYAISLIFIPVATISGIYLGNRRLPKKDF